MATLSKPRTSVKPHTVPAPKLLDIIQPETRPNVPANDSRSQQPAIPELAAAIGFMAGAKAAGQGQQQANQSSGYPPIPDFDPYNRNLPSPASPPPLLAFPQEDQNANQGQDLQALAALKYLPLLAMLTGNKSLGENVFGITGKLLGGTMAGQEERRVGTLKDWQLQNQAKNQGYQNENTFFDNSLARENALNSLTRYGNQEKQDIYDRGVVSADRQATNARLAQADRERAQDREADNRLNVYARLGAMTPESQSAAIASMVKAGIAKDEWFDKNANGNYLPVAQKQFANSKSDAEELDAMVQGLAKAGIQNLGPGGLHLKGIAINQKLASMGQPPLTDEELATLVQTPEYARAKMDRWKAQNALDAERTSYISKEFNLKDFVQKGNLDVARSRASAYRANVQSMIGKRTADIQRDIDRLSLARSQALAKSANPKGTGDGFAKASTILARIKSYVAGVEKNQYQKEDGSIGGPQVDNKYIDSQYELADRELRGVGWKLLNGKPVPMSNPPGSNDSAMIQELLGRARENGGTSRSINDLQPALATPLQKLIQASGGKVRIMSGTRSLEHQRELFNRAVKKYGSEAEARKHVAPPGGSNHNKGLAVDLEGDLELAHRLAPQFGLTFPMSYEPWHIEPAGIRGIASAPKSVASGSTSVGPTTILKQGNSGRFNWAIVK